MISHLNGKLIEKNPTALIIECGGIGYEVKISLTTFSAIGSDESIKIFTQFIVREDAQLLFGFATKEERDIFNHLISVSGIGTIPPEIVVLNPILVITFVSALVALESAYPELTVKLVPWVIWAELLLPGGSLKIIAGKSGA